MIIPRDTLEEFFSDTRALLRNGRANFNVDEVCLWSFFFVDSSPDAFSSLAAHLEACGYFNVGVLVPNLGERRGESGSMYYLRADRLERLTVDDLLDRNRELSDLAVHFGVKDYDGMDVGGIDGP